MFLQFVLVVALALSGLANAGPHAQGSTAPQERVVARTVAGVSSFPLGLTDTSGAPTGDVRLKKLEIIVPPVEPSGLVSPSEVPLGAQAAAGVVVADHLVASKRVESQIVSSVGFQTLGVTWPEGAKGGAPGGQIRRRAEGAGLKWGRPRAGGGDAAQSSSRSSSGGRTWTPGPADCNHSSSAGFPSAR